jgi:hypothetical protein
MRKPRVVDRVALQAALLVCVGTEDHGERECRSTASYVGWAMAPAHGGKRTDVTLFGVCSTHLHHRQGIEAALADRGFFGAHLVPYEKVNGVLSMLEEANLLRVAS